MADIDVNEITIQIFYGAGRVDANSSVKAYKGKIVNNELIIIGIIRNLKDGSIDIVNMKFEFVKFNDIKPLKHYIIKNRE